MNEQEIQQTYLRQVYERLIKLEKDKESIYHVFLSQEEMEALLTAIEITGEM